MSQWLLIYVPPSDCCALQANRLVSLLGCTSPPLSKQLHSSKSSSFHASSNQTHRDGSWKLRHDQRPAEDAAGLTATDACLLRSMQGNHKQFNAAVQVIRGNGMR